MKDLQTIVRPRLGFLGLGWIGRHRMEALAGAGNVEIVALADSDSEAVERSAASAPAAARGTSLEDVLRACPDGVVIATPTAQHAAQSIAVLEAGAAVFCQKPLGRDAREVADAIAAARSSDRLLATDLSYRHAAAFEAAAREVHGGRIGDISAIDLTFHNAYGPDKPWFRDRALSGGGCVIDLGVHLVDFALNLLAWPEVRCASAHLRGKGRRISATSEAVEDLAFATLETASGVPIRLTCSWNLPAGCDAVIRAEVYGTDGGVAVTNVGGSFYDFEARRHDGCRSRCLAEPPDDWGGRAAVAWLEHLRHGGRFDPDCERLLSVAAVLDEIYASAGGGP
jgi:predicted dehydrogenase